MKTEEYRERFSELKKEGLLTDAVKLFFAGMMAGDNDLTGEQARDLLDYLEFDWDAYGAVGEVALFGDSEDFKNKRIDFTREELFRKDPLEKKKK